MRLNPLNGRWVTIVPDRQRRPNDFAPRDRTIELDTDRPCPFCPGNEEETPPAIETTEADGTWSMRVVPNRYPAFFGDDAFAVHNLGPVHVKAEASGIHEVFVYSPDHFGGLDRLDDAHAAEFMFLLRRRLLEHAALPFVRYTQVIVNHGSEAGASIAHPHGQILGLPFVPGEILDEERAFARFAGGSLLETTIEAELAADQRVVLADDDVVVICPFWSGVPYEMMIVPTERQSHMQHASDRVAGRRRPSDPRHDRPSAERARRRGVQPRLPHRPAPAHRRVPLARAHLAGARHAGRLRTGHRRDDQRRAAGGSGPDAPLRSRPRVTERAGRRGRP